MPAACPGGPTRAGAAGGRAERALQSSGCVGSRYEYRVFAADLGELRRALRAEMGPGEEELREQIYLVGPGAERNVKIRDDAVEVKVLAGIHQGLEQWRPQERVPFPVSGDWVRDVLAAHLEVPPLPASEDRYDREALLFHVVVPHARLSAVPLRKKRSRHDADGLRAEHALVTAPGPPGLELQTVAVEGEDSERVLEWVGRLRLDRWPNESYVRRLRAAVG